MQGVVRQAFFRGKKLRFYATEGEGGIAPAFFENAVNLIEEEQKAVLLVEGQFHFAGAKGLGGDDIVAGELQYKHTAVGIDLKQAAVLLIFDGQGKFFAYLKVCVAIHFVRSFVFVRS